MYVLYEILGKRHRDITKEEIFMLLIYASNDPKSVHAQDFSIFCDYLRNSRNRFSELYDYNNWMEV